MLHLVVLAVLYLAVGVHPHPAYNSYYKPLACNTTSTSPLVSDCQPLVTELYKMESQGASCPQLRAFENQCTTIVRNGACDVLLCGSTGDPGCGTIGAVAQVIVEVCNKGQLIGGQADTVGFLVENDGTPNTQAIKIINHSANPNPGDIASNSTSRNVTSIKNVNASYQVPGTPYSLVVESEGSPNNALSQRQQAALATSFVTNGMQGGKRHDVTGNLPGAAAQMFMALEGNNYVSQFTQAELAALSAGMNDFRNRQGSQGYFYVAIYSGGVYIGTLIFQFIGPLL